MRESLYRDGAKQGTQAPSPAPRLIPAETENQPRTNIAIGTANGGTSHGSTLEKYRKRPYWRIAVGCNLRLRQLLIGTVAVVR